MSGASSRLHITVITLLALALAAGTAGAREVQLAGIRLGDHAIHLLDVYGQPTGIAVGEGEALAAPQMPGMGMDMGMGMPGMPGAPQLFGPPMDMGMPGMPGMPGMDPGMMGGPGGMPGMPGMEGMPGMPGMEMGMGMEGMMAGGMQTQPFPIWALAVWVDLGANEVQWIYNKGPVVLGFVLDRDGFVKVIAVAAEKCDFARTALWRPHKYVKLGDNYKHVIYRYGFPDEHIIFNSSGPGEVSAGRSTAPSRATPSCAIRKTTISSSRCMT